MGLAALGVDDGGRVPTGLKVEGVGVRVDAGLGVPVGGAVPG